MLDDAAYDANAVATSGILDYAGATFGWTGDLAPGEAVTITYSVTVADPVTGNKVLGNTVTSPVLGTNCAGGSIDARCTATVHRGRPQHRQKTSDVATSIPGGIVRYTILVTNSGRTPFVGATLSDPLSQRPGRRDLPGGRLVHHGKRLLHQPGPDLDREPGRRGHGDDHLFGHVANPDVGDRTLASTIVSPTPGSSCPSGNPATSCTTVVTIQIPALLISTSAGVSTSTPGGTVPYTVRLCQHRGDRVRGDERHHRPGRSHRRRQL